MFHLLWIGLWNISFIGTRLPLWPYLGKTSATAWWLQHENTKKKKNLKEIWKKNANLLTHFKNPDLICFQIIFKLISEINSFLFVLELSLSLCSFFQVLKSDRI